MPKEARYCECGAPRRENEDSADARKAIPALPAIESRPTRGRISLSDSGLSIVRRVGAVIIAVAAVVVWLTMGSSEKSDTAYLADVKSAMANDRLNQNTTESAPQQAVVNGWTARDLLAINARIAAAGARDDDRLAAELMLLCLAVAWLGLTSPRYRPV